MDRCYGRNTEKIPLVLRKIVRGEYLNEQAYLTPAKKKQFQIENPKKQVIDKTFLSKSENAWLQKPDVVSKGAQYSFASFAEIITEQLEEDNHIITENYFKEAVARVILFRAAEKLVSNASWYDGGYRAQTVAYTVSFLSYLIGKKRKFLNFKLIWDSQELPENLALLLEEISGKVYKKLTHPKEGHANVTQWAKTSKCWEDVKNIEVRLGLDDSLLVEKEERKYILKNDKYLKKIDSRIDKQVAVYKTKPKTWQKLYEYYKKYETDHNLSTMQMDILQKMAKGMIKVPSEKAVSNFV